MTDRLNVNQINSDQLDQLYDDLGRLRAGEEPGWDPLIVPTPGQWIARFNQASPAERLDAAERIIANAATAGRCFLMAHEKRLDEDRQAWATLARVRDVRATWALYTLEPGQVRRLLDDLTHALDEPANNSEQPARTTPDNPTTSSNSPDNPAPEQLLAVVERVRKLHHPTSVVAAAEAGIEPDCAVCGPNVWPCPTYRALDEQGN